MSRGLRTEHVDVECNGPRDCCGTERGCVHCAGTADLCDLCDGTGEYGTAWCPDCKGTGVIYIKAEL